MSRLLGIESIMSIKHSGLAGILTSRQAPMMTKTSSRGRRGLIRRMQYPNGVMRKVEGRSMQECTANAIEQARKDGYDFRKGSDVALWENGKRGE